MIRDKQIALYLAMGFELIPLRGGDGEHTSKKPLEGITWKDKVKYKGRIIDPRETADLLRSIPESNIGIATGKRSDLAVVDIDTGQDIEQARKVLSSLSLPEDTATVTTGRGLHFYFQTTGQVKSSKGPGYDIKGDGGYVVAPPSTHASGHIYTFLPGRGLDVIKPATFPDTVTGPVTLPVTLPGPDTNTPGRTAGAQGKVIRIPGGPPLSSRVRTYAVKRGLDCVKQILDRPLPVGERHDGLFMLYNLMVSNGDTREWARQTVEQKNSELKEPLTTLELQAALKYGNIYRHTCTTVKSKLPFIDCGNCGFIDIKGEQMLSGLKANKLLQDKKLKAVDFRAWYFIQTGQVDPDIMTQKEMAVFFRVMRQEVPLIIKRLTAGGYIDRDRNRKLAL